MLGATLAWKPCLEMGRDGEKECERGVRTMEKKGKNPFLLDLCFIDAHGEDRSRSGDFDHNLHVMGHERVDHRLHVSGPREC